MQRRLLGSRIHSIGMSTGLRKIWPGRGMKCAYDLRRCSLRAGCSQAQVGVLVGEYSSLHIIDDESDSRYVKAQGSAYYYNRVFCGALFFGPNTHAKYSQNDIDGLPGGMARFVDEKSVYGGCSWMLSGQVSRMNL